ncbi:DedA family protein [Salininema proteolyticum]|uniref:DedA family protein n=1 Tax=Salininema proteolyticum TaxID=1607685 RepID=A0ABV8TUA0_9ACTN
MLDHIAELLDAAGDYGPIVLGVVFVLAVLEAVFGLGAIVPAETAIVLAAMALAGSPMLLAAVPIAAAGAFLGDQIGYAVGRRFGPRLSGSRAVRKVGAHRWDEATRFVRRRGIPVIVVARLLPGVRTLVSAAAGALRLDYRRFAAATVLASLAWSALWVLGGARIGSTLLDLSDGVLAVVMAAAGAAIVGSVVFRRVRGRS